ncbi:MAG TPA: isopentenyl phosphate kinase [Methanomicrobiales archaeon]|nr:isopentenyl phosphate kinase [Methanomicrobiales archaeon]
MAEVVLLKLGGSVITHKGGECRIDEERLSEIAGVISACKKQDLLIVHGAGSCGHPEAKRYAMDRGLTKDNREGIYHIHRAVQRLNDAVVACLQGAGVNAVGLPPLGAAVARNGRLVSYDMEPARMMLQEGIVPVLHGDVVMDADMGASIISGDQILVHVAITLKAAKVGLATDVAGVLDGGRVIPKIGPATVASLPIGNSSHTDVTGGMKGKVAELIRLAEETGAESHIFHAARIGDFLKGADHGGTVVSARG